jgi:phosphomevalonate kinase
MNRLLEMHRRFQGGRGSGVDLAASLAGGVLEYRLDGTAGGIAAMEPVDFPNGLEVVVVWTGRSASTRAFLERLETGMRRDRGPLAAALADLGAVASAGIDALRTGSVPDFLDRIDRFGAAMDALGGTAGMPILSDEHRALRELGRATGVHVKPSGAGGGDMAVGFTDDADAGARFRDRAEAAGFTPLDLCTDPTGVRSSVQKS